METCNKCSRNDPNIESRLCIAALGSDPRSPRAHLPDLGKISINLLRHNATNTRRYIRKLLRNKKLEPMMRSCLADCLDLYSDAIVTLKQARQDYMERRYSDANIDVSSVLDASVTCEDGFKERRFIVSPLSERNNFTFQLSAISLCVINMLLSD
ncbi:PREDICTED: putative invertase inhibitor isoform X2 [Tarenaya hassleriana]|uniref:putative invertase inhibitor isoform X2 n=1 Tax=Tarenaya hassleriana TaxID=28532 RepID=UPI00053C467F|nr:PREDICTED: putative invertase inhibitor isoform X2 [Tarenaya hassleriana]